VCAPFAGGAAIPRGVIARVEAATAEGSARRREAALGLVSAHAPLLRNTARRVSLCPDDADDACQRALEIVLTKAPPLDPARLVAWARVVARREALAVRRSRERLVGGSDGRDAADSTPTERPNAVELAERRDRALMALRALATLKPDERRALVLQASGYSYAEIGAIAGWTYTKVNRLLAEGRAKLRAGAAGEPSAAPATPAERGALPTYSASESELIQRAARSRP
jgi:RNA polymerase sigma factor (sigma-70 family)